MTINDARQKIVSRRRELEAFDKLTATEKAQRRRAGLDPYETKATRERRKAIALEERKREFNKLPKEARDALTALGASPYTAPGTVIRRECGTIAAK